MWRQHSLFLSLKLRYPRSREWLFLSLVRNSRCRWRYHSYYLCTKLWVPLLLFSYETRNIVWLYHSYYRCTKLIVPLLLPLYKTRDFVWRYHSYYLCTKLRISCGDITLITFVQNSGCRVAIPLLLLLYKTRNIVWRWLPHSLFLSQKLSEEWLFSKPRTKLAMSCDDTTLITFVQNSQHYVTMNTTPFTFVSKTTLPSEEWLLFFVC